MYPGPSLSQELDCANVDPLRNVKITGATVANPLSKRRRFVPEFKFSVFTLSYPIG